jgi:hypothetical protein
MHAARPRRFRRTAAVARSLDRSLDRSGALLLVLSAAAVLAVMFLVMAASPARAGERRVLTGEYPVANARRLEVSVPFGEVRIEGTDDGQVRVRVEAECDGDRHCDEFLEDLRLEGKNRGGALHVKLEGSNFHAGLDFDRHDRGWDRDGDTDIDITVVVKVPRSLKVDLNMGAGEVNVVGLRQDLSIDLGAGEVNVHMLARHVGSVEVDMAVGETVIHQGGKTKEYARVLGGPVRWREGNGEAGIDVNLGAGAVEVTLD